MTKNRNSARTSTEALTELPELTNTVETNTPGDADAPEEVLFSAKDLARELNIDAKTFRRWLRAQTTDRANKGGRWIFTEESKAAFIAAYNAKAEEVTAAVEAIDADA